MEGERERGSHLSPGAVGARVRGSTHTHTHTRTREEDEGGRVAASLSCRMRRGMNGARPRRSHPANPSDHHRTPPPPDTLFLPRWQAGALHFRVLQPAGVPKEMKTMRYSGHPLPMLVASLNSHLYYLSASKSARASPEPSDRLPSIPPSPPHPSSFLPSQTRRRDTLGARVPPGACKEVGGPFRCGMYQERPAVDFA